MNVTVNWRRTEYYTSSITVDSSVVRTDLDLPEGEELTGEHVQEWLESSDPADHLDASDRDWVHADDVRVDGVEL